MPRSPDSGGGPRRRPDDSRRQRSARLARAPDGSGVRGGVGARVERIDLADCGFDTQSASGLALPVLGIATARCCASCARSSAGSFEAVTKRLGVLHALAKLGVVVWNDARAIERCVDKSMTSFLLAQRRRADAADLDDGIALKPRAPSSSAKRRAARSCSSRCSARRERACA